MSGCHVTGFWISILLFINVSVDTVGYLPEMTALLISLDTPGGGSTFASICLLCESNFGLFFILELNNVCYSKRELKVVFFVVQSLNLLKETRPERL